MGKEQREELRREKAIKKLSRPFYKKKRWWLVGIIALFFIFAALGSSGDDTNTATESSKKVSAADESSDSKKDSEKSTDKIVVVDDANYKIVITGFDEDEDIFGKSAKLKVQVENKTDQEIEVQTRSVSVDGVMFDDEVAFSETVAPNKIANDSIDFGLFIEEDEFPEFNENIEGAFVIFDNDTFDDKGEYKFNVKIKK